MYSVRWTCSSAKIAIRKYALYSDDIHAFYIMANVVGRGEADKANGECAVCLVCDWRWSGHATQIMSVDITHGPILKFT